jgi:hypothetical protein
MSPISLGVEVADPYNGVRIGQFSTSTNRRDRDLFYVKGSLASAGDWLGVRAILGYPVGKNFSRQGGQPDGNDLLSRQTPFA